MARSDIHTMEWSVEIMGQDIDVTIEYTFSPGTPDSWDEPGDPDEIEICSVKSTEFGYEMYDFLDGTRRKPEIHIFEAGETVWVYDIDTLFSQKMIPVETKRWVVKVQGPTYIEELIEAVQEHHVESYYDDYDPRDD